MNDIMPHRFITTPRGLPPAARLKHAGLWLCVFLMALGSHVDGAYAQKAQKQKPRDKDEAPLVAPRIPGTRHLSTELKLEGVETTADYILAVVNSELVVHTDVDKRVARILDSAPAGSKLPAPEVLRQQVLDALIDEKIQLQYARSLGMAVADEEVDEAVANIAAQNQISLPELRSRMKADGLDYDRYRNSLREQMMLERIRAREVNRRININDDDIDAFNAQHAASGRDIDLHLAHVLIAVPENTPEATVAKLAEKANTVRQRALAGANFNQLAKEFSDDPGTKDQGGSFGTRPADRLPQLFTDAVKSLKVGDIAPLFRSGAGFHVLKLVERQNAKAGSYTQQRARHILIRTSAQTTEKTALDRMNDIRKQIVGGQASFAQMAREHSQDGSATKGGDLGFASPGQFVPEFERALSALQPGEMSPTVVTRFGVHLIQLIERREVALTEQQKRDAVRGVLREQRFESAYEDWARELRAAAFVDMRNAP
jgi:peptidyl-prolyl cis-trans isomerase SurA